MTEQDSIPGINGGLMRRQGPSPTMGKPLNSYVCSIVVDSIDESVVAAHAKNAMIAVPKMAIPNVGGLRTSLVPKATLSVSCRKMLLCRRLRQNLILHSNCAKYSM
jgi:predicted enzyme related to lactoylglutathione lyase